LTSNSCVRCLVMLLAGTEHSDDEASSPAEGPLALARVGDCWRPWSVGLRPRNKESGAGATGGFFGSVFSLPFDFVKAQLQKMKPDPHTEKQGMIGRPTRCSETWAVQAVEKPQSKSKGMELEREATEEVLQKNSDEEIEKKGVVTGELTENENYYRRDRDEGGAGKAGVARWVVDGQKLGRIAALGLRLPQKAANRQSADNCAGPRRLPEKPLSVGEPTTCGATGTGLPELTRFWTTNTLRAMPS